MRIIVCGGAGYIGSHMCRLLADSGHQVAVIDDLSTGHREAVHWGPLYQGNIGDSRFVQWVFTRIRPDAVFHFAARSLVGESMSIPAAYYRNNFIATWNLLEEVRGVPGCLFVFSSTAAVFGAPEAESLTETELPVPINAYGHSKLAVEFALRDYAAAYGLSSATFRYFNAAGAAPAATIGEAHSPETHLIPCILESALNRRDAVTVFGGDYDTHDGTCIRDYVHVDDLCRAHLCALEFLRRNPGAHFFNLGNGTGFSVREVLAAAESVVGTRLGFRIGPRRNGDPARLVANAALAREALGWQPQHSTLETIVESAWRWHRQRSY